MAYHAPLAWAWVRFWYYVIVVFGIALAFVFTYYLMTGVKL